MSSCPKCGGDYVITDKCSVCDDYIDGVYIEVWDGQKICNRCYREKDVNQ